MPGSYAYTGSVLRLTFHGETPLADVGMLLDQALSDPDRPERPNVLSDMRGSTSITKRPGHELREGMGFFGSHAETLGGRHAILVGSELQFGVMRIASVYSESLGVDTQVFDDLAEAEAWLAGGSE